MCAKKINQQQREWFHWVSILNAALFLVIEIPLSIEIQARSVFAFSMFLLNNCSAENPRRGDWWVSRKEAPGALISLLCRTLGQNSLRIGLRLCLTNPWRWGQHEYPTLVAVPSSSATALRGELPTCCLWAQCVGILRSTELSALGFWGPDLTSPFCWDSSSVYFFSPRVSEYLPYS